MVDAPLRRDVRTVYFPPSDLEGFWGQIDIGVCCQRWQWAWGVGEGEVGVTGRGGGIGIGIDSRIGIPKEVKRQ